MTLPRVVLLLVLCSPLPAAAIPAFPGAEGMGADTIGGRGGTVYIVDTLSDDPADGVTFREACEASGPRYVVFRVSGIIDTTRQINITHPYITIAGETSPGGIVVTGWQTNIETHDVLIRHMRFRLGAHRANDSVNAEVNDALCILGSDTSSVTAYNIMIDHCSISWGLDETASVNYNAQDVTFSWCFITSGLMNSNHPDGSTHSAGFIAWGKYSDPYIKVSLHHTFIGYSYFRLPENNYDSFIDSVNNVAYYWQTTYSHEVGNQSGYVSTANIIGTYRKINTSISSSYTRSAFILDYDTNPVQRIYMTGCLDGSRTSQQDPQWSALEYWHDSLLSTDWRANTPWPTTGHSGTGIAVTATPMDSAYASYVVANAGATKPFRDGVDAIAAANYESGAGGFTNASDVDTLAKISDLVNLSSPPAPVDADDDGMSDVWENAAFGNLDQTATTDFDGDGYDDIEEYFHFLTKSKSMRPPRNFRIE